MERFTPQSEKSPEKNNGAREEAISSISRVLEECEKNNEDTHILEEALTASPKALSELYDKVTKKYKTIIGALLFAVASHTVEAQTLPEDLETQITQLKQSINTTGNEVVEKNTGINFIKEAERIGRNATFYMSGNATAHTIVHLGQTHNTTKEMNYAIRHEIATSQAEIATILLNTTDPSTGVFMEGHTQKGEILSDAEKEASTHLKGARDINELKSIYEEECERNPYTTNIAIINKITGDKLISFGFTETSPFMFTNTHEEFLLYATGSFPKENSFTVPNEVESSIVGATRILDAEGRIDMYPAETTEGNSRSFQLEDNLNEKGEMLGDVLASVDFSNTSYLYLQREVLPTLSKYSADQIESIAQSEMCVENPECQKIVAEILYKDIPAIKKAIFDDREDIAIKLIAEYAKTSNQTYFPLVYGSDHDFIRAVMQWNKEHPEQQFNLVTVK